MVRRGAGSGRLLATIMFTDIVGSTELAGRMGDRGWKRLLDRHNSIVRREIRRSGGREQDTAGDGFFVAFDRPAQALECAASIIDALRPLELQIRAAIHMGEVESMGRKVGGIAVHATSRVLGITEPGRIFVTSIVRDLAAGSEYSFEDRGTHQLRGVEGEWRLYAVVEAAPPVGPTEPEPATTPSRSRPWALVALASVAAAVVVVVVGAYLLANSNSGAPIMPQPNSVLRFDPVREAFTAQAHIEAPTELAFDGGGVWALSLSGRTVSRIDPTTMVSAPVGLPAAPTGIGAGDGAIWISAGFGSTSSRGGVLRVGSVSRSIEATYDLQSGVDAVAVGEGSVWVTNRLYNVVSRIDLTTLSVASDIAVGEQPESVTVGGGWIWVGSTVDRTIWRIDPNTFEAVNQLTLADAPYDLAYGFDRLWVSSTTGNSVVVIDGTSTTIQQTIDVPAAPRGLTVGTESVWVALGSGALLRIDPANPGEYEEFSVDGSTEDVVVAGDAVWTSVRE